MPIGKAYKAAWSAHDSATQALKELQAQPGPMSESKALAIARLCEVIDKLQDRIRIHRRVPLPGTARPSSKKRVVRNGYAPRVLVEAPTPAPDPRPIAGLPRPDPDPDPDPTEEPPFES